MHSKSDNVETMISAKADKIIETPFQTFETTMKGSRVIFDHVDLFFIK